MVLKNETKKKVDTSKTYKYCIDVKGWKGIGHTEPECFTKKREAGKKSKKVDAGSDEEDGNVLCIKVGKIETKDGYFQYDTAATNHTTNKASTIKDPQYGEFLVRGHDGSTSICRIKRTLVFHHHEQNFELKDCLYDPMYSGLISGQQINPMYPNLHIETNESKGMISTKNKELFDLEVDRLGAMWIRAE